MKNQHTALETEFALENLIQSTIVLAGIGFIDKICRLLVDLARKGIGQSAYCNCT